MATAQEIIEDALSDLGVVDAVSSASGEDIAFCLNRLNRILERWSNERLMVYVPTTVTVTMTGAASYTIGPSGGTVALRPVAVLNAISTVGGVDRRMEGLSLARWRSIAQKTVSGDVWSYYYAPEMPNGRLYVYPQASSGTVTLDCQSVLGSFADTATDLALPPGYQEALSLCLAVSVAGAYERKVTDDLRLSMAAAKRAIKRTNAPTILAAQELALVGDSDYRIERGY